MRARASARTARVCVRVYLSVFMTSVYMSALVRVSVGVYLSFYVAMRTCSRVCEGVCVYACMCARGHLGFSLSTCCEPYKHKSSVNVDRGQPTGINDTLFQARNGWVTVLTLLGSTTSRFRSDQAFA